MAADQQTQAAPAAVFGGLGPAEYERLTRELTGYCYRMLGSPFDAEDAVQDTMMRAWRDLERFEGRSSLRTWLYRIATNVCIDMLRGRSRRGVPMDLQPPSAPVESQIGSPLGEPSWVLPIPDAWIQADGADPAQHVVLRESVRLAFVAAIQRLTPRQRAVLILRDVLQYSAAESAGLLGSTVASANSALQRARVALSVPEGTSDAAGPPGTPAGTAGPTGDAAPDPGHALLEEYVAAFESYDMSRLTAVLRSDVVMSMPPLAIWLRGPDHIAQWLLGPGTECRGSRLLATAANGCAAYAQYRRDPGGGYAPWAIQVVETDGDRISGLHCYVIPALFAAFGFPSAL